MKVRRNILGVGAGATILGIALCVPASMLAQTSTAPPDTSPNQTEPSTSQGTTPSRQYHQRRHHKMTAQDQLRRLTKELNLTESQQQQMLPVLQDQQQKMESMHNNTSMSREERQQQARQSMQETNQKLEALMTDTQKQKFEQMKQERRAHMKERHHNGMGMHQGAPNEGTPPPPADNGAPPPQL